MINITPDTDRNTQVTVHDRVRMGSWKLNAQVDLDDLTFTISSPYKEVYETFTGNEITEERVEEDGRVFWRYYVITTIPATDVYVEYKLEDPANSAVDTAHITANSKITV